MFRSLLSNIGRSSNFANTRIYINPFEDLSRPSFPSNIQRLLPSIITEFENIKSEFFKTYPWLEALDTVKTYDKTKVNYSNKFEGSASFNTFNVGRYNTETNVWSWSWVDHHNEFVVEDDSNVFREYGSKKRIELMIKANWEATNEEITEILAVCLKLKSAIGIDIEKKDQFQYYSLLLE